jgi:hypothetical protein
MLMKLKPQDLLFLLKLVAIENRGWSFNQLSIELGMSPAEVHAASKRSVQAQLAVKIDGRVVPIIRNLTEFIVHGLKYVFIPDHGTLTRGMPTSYAYGPLSSLIVLDDAPPPVWPCAEGTVRGLSFSPLYSSVPVAAQQDKNLYELLALVDAIRGGRKREQNLAIEEMSKRLNAYE